MIQHVTRICPAALHYVRPHNQAAHNLHQELAIKCRIVKGKLTACYEDESQFVLWGTHIINCTVTGP
jgi:hypothetical protein